MVAGFALFPSGYVTARIVIAVNNVTVEDSNSSLNKNPEELEVRINAIQQSK